MVRRHHYLGPAAPASSSPALAAAAVSRVLGSRLPFVACFGAVRHVVRRGHQPQIHELPLSFFSEPMKSQI